MDTPGNRKEGQGGCVQPIPRSLSCEVDGVSAPQGEGSVTQGDVTHVVQHQIPCATICL